MVALESLSRPRQLDVFRAAADEALAHFDVHPRQLRVLRFIRNAVFRVETDRGKWLVLRVYRAEHQDPRRAHLEAAFLARLAQHSTVRAPRPVSTREGSYLLEFGSRALGGRAFAVVLRPVLGRRPPIACPSARTVNLAGAVLARIHAEGRAMALGTGLRLAHADWGPFIRDGLRFPRAVQSHFGASTLRALRRRMEDARGFLRNVSRRQLGVLHGDFHQGNYVLSRGAVCPIDFADCAVGPIACDVATAVTALAGRSGYAAKRAAFLRGYRSENELVDVAEEDLDSLVAVRVGISLNHVFGRSDHPYLEPKKMRNYLAITQARLRAVGVAV